jgi:hypothetical protein
VAGLLLPLYAPRAFETDTWGPDAASLATAAPIADAFELAYYCVRNSQLHPRFRSLPPLHTYVYLGEDANWVNQRDSLAPGLDEELGWVQGRPGLRPCEGGGNGSTVAAEGDARFCGKTPLRGQADMRARLQRRFGPWLWPTIKILPISPRLNTPFLLQGTTS